MKLTQLVGLSLLVFSLNLLADPGGVIGIVPTAPLPPPVTPATDVGGIIGTVPTAPLPATPSTTNTGGIVGTVPTAPLPPAPTCSNGQAPHCMSTTTAPVCPDTSASHTVGGTVGQIGTISCGSGLTGSCTSGTPTCVAGAAAPAAKTTPAPAPAPAPIVPTCKNGHQPSCPMHGGLAMCGVPGELAICKGATTSAPATCTNALKSVPVCPATVH